MDPSRPADVSLQKLVESVADRQPVDWGSSSAMVKDSDHGSLTNLQNLSRLQEVHDGLRAALVRNDPDTESVNGLSESPEGIGVHWGALEITSLLGEGSAGQVYAAFDSKLHRQVALKILRPLESPTSESNVLSEARRLAQVSHPNVVTVYGADTIDGQVGIWTELIEGSSLQKHVDEFGPLGEDEVASYGRTILGALAAVHDAGLLHRDIKPANVMRNKEGKLVLLDFSSAVGSADRDLSVGGTGLFMAPEMVLGAGAQRTSDIYSVGALMFWLLTKRHPVEAENFAELHSHHQSGARNRIRDLRPGISSEMVAIVEKALEPDAAKRYPTAGAMEAALAKVLVPATPSSYEDFGDPHTAPSLAGEKSRGLGAHTRRKLILIALAAVVSVAVAVGLGTRWRGPGPLAMDVDLCRNVSGIDQSLNSTVVQLGDELSLRLHSPEEVHVYVFNHDDAGNAYLLFPLKGVDVSNPIQPGRTRIPGSIDGKRQNWAITGTASQELIYVIASREPLVALESALDRMPTPSEGVVHAGLAFDDRVRMTRGLGSLVPMEPPPASSAGLEEVLALVADQQSTSDDIYVEEFFLRRSDGQ